MTIPAHLIPARTRIFSDRAVGKLTRTSRTKRWRERRDAKKAEAETKAKFPNPLKPNQRFNGYQGFDVVAHFQQLRADAGLDPMDEADILVALIEAEAEADRERVAARAARALAKRRSEKSAAAPADRGRSGRAAETPRS